MKKQFLFLFAMIFLSGFALSFGVSNNYEQPMQMYPGETRNIYLILQNNAGTDDLTVQAQIIQDSAIAKILDASDVYYVPHRQPVDSNLSLTLPADTKLNQTYRVKVRYLTISNNGSMFAVDMGANLDILVIEKPVPKTTTPTQVQMPEKKPDLSLPILFIVGLAIIIVFIILATLLRKRK